jgi:hypothetical protein
MPSDCGGGTCIQERGAAAGFAAKECGKIARLTLGNLHILPELGVVST